MFGNVIVFCIGLIFIYFGIEMINTGVFELNSYSYDIKIPLGELSYPIGIATILFGLWVSFLACSNS